MKNKMNLKDLNIESFITSIEGEKVSTLKGGSAVSTDPIECPIAEEKTGIGASCEWTMCHVL